MPDEPTEPEPTAEPTPTPEPAPAEPAPAEPAPAEPVDTGYSPAGVPTFESVREKIETFQDGQRT